MGAKRGSEGLGRFCGKVVPRKQDDHDERCSEKQNHQPARPCTVPQSPLIHRQGGCRLEIMWRGHSELKYFFKKAQCQGRVGGEGGRRGREIERSERDMGGKEGKGKEVEWEGRGR